MSKIITFEGYDNVGKTTFINFFKDQLLNTNTNVYTIKHPSDSIFGETALKLIEFLYKTRDKIISPPLTKENVTKSILDLVKYDKEHILAKYKKEFNDPKGIILQDRSILSEYVYHYEYINKYNINIKKNNNFYPKSDITFVFSNGSPLEIDDNSVKYRNRYNSMFKYHNVTTDSKEKIDVGLCYLIPVKIPFNTDNVTEDEIFQSNMKKSYVITKLLKKHRIL